MKQISTIGLDLAKRVFQVHGADAEGLPPFNRKLRRSEVLRFFGKLPACLVGMEACGSAHYWAREIAALGHEVRLIPPAYLKPFVKRGKRSGRRGSYQRSGDPQDHAICSNQECRAASKCDGAEDPRSSGTAANAVNQRSARTSRRIGHRLRHRSDKDYRADSDRKG